MLSDANKVSNNKYVIADKLDTVYFEQLLYKDKVPQLSLFPSLSS